MTIHEILAAFKTKRILVVGDVMIDAYMLGKVHRVSPEAPVPIVSLESEEQRLGGAANVALNLQSLGATPILCALVGADKDGRMLKELLEAQNMLSTGIVSSENRVTTVKTRVIGNQQQLLRIDAEDTHPLNQEEEEAFLSSVRRTLETGQIDAIIFEDYNKGLLTPAVIEGIIELAKKHAIPTTVDPKKDNFLAYKGVTLFKPNMKELKEGVGIDCSFQKRALFDQAVEVLEQHLQNEITFVTLSEYGVYIKNGDRKHHAPAHVRTIADVSGAGDTVISVATLCLTADLSVESIAELSNLAGGLVCEKSGVVSIDPDQLIQECEGKQYR
ncbi:bifunctional heptose 7-phosphate kinase/heptose 1-phosphate adenyltransferase [Fluviicola chungangensis]|uniref:D-glycero-beta-D-manno-heptose-7-phosphate kinase n=1 Tax=Fluviicola chungangensis TaxID=2597671 RepID=A0A556MR73_9FLAO|nr:bifunctional ADP-heptose synthase [Fluviicola chungangensis]TSJ42420.1 D-glycero-beta-D-manno-heptose-7-phosphate kinase [Fluviicola chungangensis]